MGNQFSERQLIRWAVPGWITLFLVIVIIAVHLVCNGDFRTSFQTFVESKNFIGAIAAAGGAAIAIGFALGFILFQIYFVLYWCDRRLGRFSISGFVGRFVNYEAVVKSLEEFRPKILEEFGDWPVNSSDGTPRQNMEASVVAVWWRGISHNVEQRMTWENRNQYLVAVYHSLGANIVGTYLAGLTYLIVMWCCGWFTGQNLVPVLINFAILFLWCVVLFRGRRNTEFSHRNLTIHALNHFYQQDTQENNGS